MSAVRDAALLRPLKGVKFRDAGNVLRTAPSVRMRDVGNALRTIFSALSATLSVANVYGFRNSGSSVTITTNSVTATPEGGSGPYSYAWIKTSGGGNWSIGAASSATTTFSASGIGPEDEDTATFQCTVTDANGSTALTGTVTAYVSNNYSPGGFIP